VITFVHRATGATCSTVALRKGVWPYAVQILSNFVIFIGQMKVRIRGDGEHPLQSLLAAVASKLRADGIIVDVPESTAVSGHQGIGSAEKHHDIIAGYARTYANQVYRNTGLRIMPATRLFAWLIRYCLFIVTNYHLRVSGQTSLFYAQRVPMFSISYATSQRR